MGGSYRHSKTDLTGQSHMVPHPFGRPWRLEWSYRIPKTQFVHGLLGVAGAAPQSCLGSGAGDLYTRALCDRTVLWVYIQSSRFTGRGSSFGTRRALRCVFHDCPITRHKACPALADAITAKHAENALNRLALLRRA